MRIRIELVTFVILCEVLSACGGDRTDKEGKKASPSAPAAAPAPPPANAASFHVNATPADMVKVNARLENSVELLGYTIGAQSVAPGNPVTVTWYWKARSVTSGKWEYFTHLIDATGTHVSGLNSSGPMRAVYKPEMWPVGQIIKDEERIVVPADWSSPLLELRTGLWSGSSRMKVTRGSADEENRVKGPAIQVSVSAPVVAPPPPTDAGAIDVPFARKAPKIDGVIDGDPAWADGLELEPFTDTLTGGPVPRTTRVRLLWDNRFLYIAMSAQDVWLRSHFTKRDEELWKEDAFEVFLDPGADGKDYFEFQVSPAGVLFDATFPEYRKGEDGWNSDVVAAVKTQGTLNDETPDEGWTAEMAIPLKNLEKGGVAAAVDTIIGANFFRVDMAERSAMYSGWSPPMRGDFHALDRFGHIRLVKN